MPNLPDQFREIPEDDQPSRKDEIYTESEAAALLKMTPRRLADRRRAGKIACIKDGRYVAFTRQHIEEYCRAYRRGSVFSDNAGADEEIVLMSLSGSAARSIVSQFAEKAKRKARPLK
jgi:hypothetical protein